MYMVGHGSRITLECLARILRHFWLATRKENLQEDTFSNPMHDCRTAPVLHMPVESFFRRVATST